MASSKSENALFIKLFLMAKSEADMEKLLDEIFSPAELDRAIQRIVTTKALLKGKTYRDIESQIGASTYVIYRAKSSIVNAKFGIVKRFLKTLREID
jgi:uncharacterized protein YerC